MDRREYNRQIAFKVLEESEKLAKKNNKLREAIYHASFPEVKFDTNQPEAEIIIKNIDTFAACKELIDLGCSPIGLNMASDMRVGGGWLNGAMAQEESLFLRSSYSASLSKGIENQYYPLQNTDVIYSPHVYVYRENNGFLKEPYEVAMVACPAVRNPKVINDEYRKLIKARIRCILATGINYKHNAIVLGAWGCGAFRNPIDEIAKAFKEVLNEGYKYCYKYVYFAILDNSPGKKQLEIFNRILC